MCSVRCSERYDCVTGCEDTFKCDDGALRGEPVACELKRCANGTGVPDGFDSECGDATVGEWCLVSCPAGFEPASDVFYCGLDGKFSGTPPTCKRLECAVQTLPSGFGVQASGCLGLQAGQSCTVSCVEGFKGGSETLRCGLDGVFAPSSLRCESGALGGHIFHGGIWEGL